MTKEVFKNKPEKKVGILRFLGTNCDRDIWTAVESVEMKPEWLWFEDHFDSSDYEGIIVPGGFSYGDYLRAGALAARTPAMESLREAAQKGLPILGICNGFQILCESGLLPGALVENESRKFVDEWSELQLENSKTSFAKEMKSGTVIQLPIAHGEGRFYANEEDLKKIEDNGMVWWRYKRNPNGSFNDIAGVTNQSGNVAGLMPHPERALFGWMTGNQNAEVHGLAFFSSLG